MEFRRRRTDLGAGALKSNQPELADLVFRSLDLKGQLPQELRRDYSLEMRVEDFTRPEFYRARRRGWWANSKLLSAVAANVNVWQLTAPTGEMLTVCERIVIAAAVTDYFRIALSTPAAGLVLVGGKSLDSRNGTALLSGASIFQAGPLAVSPIGSGSLVCRVPANETMEIAGPWILGGGNDAALIVSMDTANAGGTVGFVWSERHATAAELK